MQPSQFTRQNLICPVCLNEEETTLWTSINAVTDPDLKERLLRKTLQIHPCSNCGHEILLSSAMIYLDPQQKILIACEPELADAGNWQPSFELAGLADWTIRLTVHSNQLIEKIHIFDADLDDRLVELLKLSLLRQKDQPVEAEQLFFYRAKKPGSDDKLRFMVAAADGQWYQLELERSVYQNIADVVAEAGLGLPQGWQVDGEMAADMLAELVAKSKPDSDNN